MTQQFIQLSVCYCMTIIWLQVLKSLYHQPLCLNGQGIITTFDKRLQMIWMLCDMISDRFIDLTIVNSLIIGLAFIGVSRLLDLPFNLIKNVKLGVLRKLIDLYVLNFWVVAIVFYGIIWKCAL